MASYLIQCKACGSSNRIPAEKEGVASHCGNCHAALPPLYCTPQQMTADRFDRFLASYPGPVLAEFWAPW